MVALGMFLVGSLITLFAQNLRSNANAVRILQGSGSGGCFTLGTAIIFDAFQKDRAIAAINNMNTIIPLIMGCTNALADTSIMLGFRSNFLAIAIFCPSQFPIVCLFLF